MKNIEEYRRIQLNSILSGNSFIDNIVDEIINENYLQDIIFSNEFYLSNCLKLYKQFKEFDILKLKTKIKFLNDNISTPFKYKDLIEFEDNEDFKSFLVLIGRIITYFDAHGWNINEWNEYEDKRVISKANLSQDKWLTCFLHFKLNNCSLIGIEDKLDNAFKRSIDYIENPIDNFPITSKNHRNQISNYFNLSTEKEILNLFNKHTNKVYLKENKSALIVRILYHPKIKKHWLESVIGLMASDNTGWQDETIELLNYENYDACILWNSKRPTGTNNTLKKLSSIIEDEGFFYLYYSQGSIINYRAKILDFIENQNQLDKTKWESKYANILDFYPTMEEYSDGKKYASIIFLAEKLEQILPLKIEDFTFYNSSRPTQDNLSPIKSINSKEIKIMYSNKEIQYPLNQIFYGSPGTGKTFNTINNAISLLENIPLEILNKESRTDLKNRYDKAISDGKIVFSTFHQNMNYEDFIEGIKPQKPKSDDSFLKYEIKDGIFKKLCKTALESLLFNYESKKEINTSNNTFSFEEYFNKYLSHIKNVLVSNDKYIVKQLYGSEVQVVNISESGTFELRYLSKIGDIKNEDYRPTLSKSYLQKLYDSGNPPSYFVGNIRVKMKDIAGSCAHPSPYYAIYNDFYIFINGNFNLDENGEKEEMSIKEELSYEELVRRFAEYKIPKDEILSIVEENRYVIIIDEINRGNVSAIFGELITLIETDKRLGMDEYITLQLPYSKEVFSVPPNVYIIGTMNTADRSVEALDTALRRRFHFTEMSPNYELQKLKEPIFENLTLGNILKTINDRIEYLLNKDHTIGHSYFLNVKSIGDLENSFFKNIIPLLQEYFYGDYSKMSLVIGDGFFESHKDKPKVEFAKGLGDAEVPEKTIVTLKTKWEDGEFEKAIQILLGNETK